MGIRAAVIGTGYIGQEHLRALRGEAEELILCSRNEARAAALAAEYGARWYRSTEEMYRHETPDMVSVCLPTDLHAAAVREALEHGCAVLCEKPFASTAAEAKALCTVARERGLLLMVGHPLRFTARYEYLRRCIAEGRFGALQQLTMYRHSAKPTWSTGGWLLDPTRSGGVVTDLHIHETDLVLWLCGMPQEVLTVGDSMVCTTVYRYETGCSVTAMGSWREAPDYPFTAGYDAVFERAALSCRGQALTLFPAEGGAVDPLLQEPFSERYAGDLMENEVRYFCHCLREGQQPTLCPPEDAWRALVVNEAERRSMETAAAVRPVLG